MEFNKIYFDMDGVLANFEKGVSTLCDFKYLGFNERDKDYDNRMWDAIRKVDNFYYKLEIMDGMKELFLKLYNLYPDKVEILTGIPKPFRNIKNADIDKINWVHDYLDKNVKVNCVLRQDKILYSNEKAILIDDYLKNINEWESNKGIGILFENSEDLEKKLKVVN